MLLSAISLLLVAEQRKTEATIHTVHDATQRYLTWQEAEEEEVLHPEEVEEGTGHSKGHRRGEPVLAVDPAPGVTEQ